MPKQKQIETASSSRWDSETRLLAWLATCVSVFSFLFYFKHGDVTLYGDAIAHMNIARRVFDSKTPGLLQLGTVWLPLPHLLMIPFLLSTEMWKRGVGGSIPSMAAYVLAVIGIFRLLRGTFSSSLQEDAAYEVTDRTDQLESRFAAHVGAWIGAIAFAANPNLIYMQTTAMGESLYLAFFIWAVVYLSEFVRGDSKGLTRCGLCLAAACLTRYDGWFLSAAIAAVILLWSMFPGIFPCKLRPIPHRCAVQFLLLAASAPLLWLAYNGIVYRNPLEFANGPYSARAIERRTESAGHPGHPGSGNPVLAEMYFLKSAEANAAGNEWLGRAWIFLLLAACAIAAFTSRRNPACWPLWFLLMPLPFYALSVAYGGVPIFIPAWWPFTHYNVRYGLQLLPAFAVGIGVLAAEAVRFRRRKLQSRFASVLVLLAFIIASYTTIWSVVPVSLEEARVNMRSRHQLETQLAGWLEKLPSDSTLLMYLGDHVGAAQQAGIPLRRIINEGNHRTWKQPTDPDGLWERALANPARYADYIVAFDGDSVWQAVQSRGFPELVEIHVTGQARGILYRAR